MDQDDPPLDYASIASDFGKAKALKERDDASRRTQEADSAESPGKCKEVQFKVSHGLLILFFTWLL